MFLPGDSRDVHPDQVAAAEEEREDRDNIEEESEVLAQSLKGRAEERDDRQQSDENCYA